VRADYHEAPLKTGKLSTGREYVAKAIAYKPVMQADSPFSIVQENTIREAEAYPDKFQGLSPPWGTKRGTPHSLRKRIPRAGPGRCAGEGRLQQRGPT